MADMSPRNPPKSPFSGLPGPEIPRAPYKGPGMAGESSGLMCWPVVRWNLDRLEVA